MKPLSISVGLPHWATQETQLLSNATEISIGIGHRIKHLKIFASRFARRKNSSVCKSLSIILCEVQRSAAQPSSRVAGCAGRPLLRRALSAFFLIVLSVFVDPCAVALRSGRFLFFFARCWVMLCASCCFSIKLISLGVACERMRVVRKLTQTRLP